MPTWTTKGVHVVLSLDLAIALFLRADQGDRERGGLYEARYGHDGVAILIWHMRPIRPETAHGVADFHWRTPFDGEITLWRLGWDTAAGGSEALVWEALDVLAGRPLRPT